MKKKPKSVQEFEDEITATHGALSQAINVGDPELARSLSKKLRELRLELEDAGAAELAVLRQQQIACEKIKYDQHRKRDDEERKQRDIREGVGLTPVQIVAKEIENAELMSPFCQEPFCGLKLTLDKHEMPFTIDGSRTANWLWTCIGSKEKPHPPMIFRREIRRLYPSREINPELWKAAVEASRSR